MILQVWKDAFLDPWGALGFGLSGSRAASIMWELRNVDLKPGVQPLVIHLMVGTVDIFTSLIPPLQVNSAYTSFITEH